jgi:pectate lyase
VGRIDSAAAVRAALLAALLAGCDARLYPIREAPTGEVHCPDGLVGFATEDGGTTGGGDATPVTVTTADDFIAAAGGEAPAVIQVNGNIALTARVKVKSNKTVVGVGPASGFTGSGLDLTDSENVVVRNLLIARAVGEDAVTVQRSRHIWIDHCDLASDRDHEQGYYDGLVDVTHASDFITVSWTVLHDHFDSSTIGHSDSNADEDTGHLTVTYHHNHFKNIEAGPRVRFGSVHLYNNHFEDLTLYAVASQMGAAVLVEDNWFDGVGMPILTHYKSPEDGTAHEQDNVYRNSGTADITMETSWRPTYLYTPESADSARALVDFCAGVGKLP